MSVREVVRCSGTTGRGTRCARRTARTSYCYQHLEKQEHLKIKKSGIPNAGLGLFTTVKRKPGDKVAPYTGKIVITHDPDYGNPYALQVKKHPPTFVDASVSTAGAGRFSNNCRNGQCRNNAALSYNANQRKASVKAKQVIMPGKEVYTAYGRGYW